MASTSSSSNVENLPPHIIKRISREVIDLSENPPAEGIKMYINEEDITDIQASIEGPAGTPYEGGLFKMKLVLSKEFPAVPPQGFFLTKIFHPNVAKNGAICVNTLKKDWKPDHGIKHILLTVKCLLIYPNPESALNEEAGRLLLEQYDEYFRHAQMMTDIHSKPPKSSSSYLSTTTTRKPDHSSSETIEENGEIETKKRALEKGAVPAGSGTGSVTAAAAIDKKKKDKKKALKRL